MMLNRRISTLQWRVITFVTITLHGAAAYCTFPMEWRGQWHQNNIGDVLMSDNEISRKGRCTENKHDYYLLENRDIGCFTCLQITQRHHNILQYKESYCVGKDNIYAICKQIQISTIMHTLIREPSVPIACPFHDAYHFSYNNNSGGYCREPASYAKPCASAAQIRLHFSHCSNAAYTHQRAVDLECLGLWKEGSEQYMVGQLTGEGLRTKDTRYRCFMYNMLGTLIYMAMSWDSSCFGILSPTNGPITLEFTQDSFGWPMPSCKFPRWLSESFWKDLSGRHLFESNEDHTIMTELFKQDFSALAEEQKAYRCHKVLERNTTEKEFSLISFTSHGCSTNFQCLKFFKRKDGVIEIHEGKYMTYETDPCLESDMLSSNTKLLIPQDAEPRHCPGPGRYTIHTGSDLCTGYFRVGCNSSSVLDIVSSCSSKPGVQLECLKAWRENKKKYLVARVLGDKTGTTNCFSFRKKDRSWYFAVDNDCNKGAPYILKSFVTYVLDTEPLECHEVRTHGKGVRSDNQSAHDDSKEEDTRQGGQYQHVDPPVTNRNSCARITQSYTYTTLSVIFVLYMSNTLPFMSQVCTMVANPR